MHKKSKRLIALTFSSAACLLFAMACKQEPIASVNGFDVRNSLTVEYGETVVLENPFVTDENGWVLESWSMVTDDEGNYVYTENGRFLATDSDGYVITYVVRDKNDNIFEKKTEIIVKGTVADQITIDAAYEQSVTIGEQIQINATCSDATATLNYTVEKKSDGSLVEVTDNTFTLTQAGAYTVTIADGEGKAEYEYMLFAQNPVREGEVEIFDEAWAERQKYTGSKRRTWDVVSTDECGILDPYGQPANYATFTTNKEYISLYLTMRESKEYYQQLAQEGYKTVSMWIYADSQKTHKSVSDRDPLGGSFYRKDGPTVTPGKWVQHTMNLVDSAAAYNRSFVSCYDYYQNEAFRYLLVDNSWDWNPQGGGDEITFYITDVYATKSQTITPKSDVETQKTVTDEIEFANLFDAECELEYSVTYRGEKLGIPTPTYEFMGSGEYTVTAVPKLRNLRGSGSIKFSVGDEQTLQAKQLIKERIASDLSINLSELQMQFAEKSGVTPQITDYKVYYNDKELTKSGNTFTADKDGSYTVEAKGEYVMNGKSYVSYKTTTVDVWSTGSKYAFIDSANLLYTSIYTDWDPDPTGSYKGYTVDERTGNMIRSYSKGQSNSVYGKPLYSKYYYQKMLEEKPNAELVLDIYIKATGGTSEYVRGLFTAYKTSKTVKNNVWNRYSIDLQAFIDEYDTVATTYEKYKEIRRGGGRPSQSSNGTGALMLLFGDKSYAREIYMQIAVSEQASTMTVALKNGAAFELEGENKLSEILDVKLNGVGADILSTEVKYNGSWIRVKDSVFTPFWAGEYEFRFNARSEKEGVYHTFETVLAIGERDFTYVEDEQTYTLIGDADFDFGTLTDKDYAFEFEVYTDGGYKKKVETVETDENLIKGASLANGSYLIDVYAVKGEGDFSRVLYYTFKLNYFDNEKEMVWAYSDVKPSKLYQYASSTTNINQLSITTNIPEGGVSGSYIKYSQGQGIEQAQFRLKPVYNKSYYEFLLQDTTKKFKVYFDVYLQQIKKDANGSYTNVQTGTIKPRVLASATATSLSGGTAATLNTWHTYSYDLKTLVNAWGTSSEGPWFFGCATKTNQNPRTYFYLGNIRLVEESV